MKKVLLFLIVFSLSFSAFSQNFICQPYYGGNKLRFYTKTGAVASAPFYTLDVSADVSTAFGVNLSGPNSVVVYNNKVFVSFDINSTSGGVLIYNFADIYPSRTANAPIVIKPGGSPGNICTGITVNPANGDLYVSTVNGAPNVGGIYKYTAASNYAAESQFSNYNTDNSVASICAGLAFDASGNLWMHTWDDSMNANQHYLICYKSSGGVLNKNNYYKITNTATASYSAVDVSGTAHNNLHLLSMAEGIAFDGSGNLWIANNNDGARTNIDGQGTLVKITAAGIASILANAANGSSFTIPSGNADIKYIQNGKLGGISFDGNNLYINDQGQSQGTDFTANGTVWKWDITTAFNATNFVASGIKTTYPGFGQMALVPCSLLPANPTVTPTSASITSGNSVTLTANCAAGTTYLWNTGATTSAISPAPTTTTIYNAYCVSGTCQSSGTSVTVTVTASCTAPAPPVLTVAPIVPYKSVGLFISTTYHNGLTASGCAGTVTWNTGATTTTIDVPAAVNPSTAYTATCTMNTCVSSAAVITLNYIVPPVTSASPLNLCDGQNTIFTATGCSGIVNWYRYSSSIIVNSGTYTSIGTGNSLVYAPSQGSGSNTISYLATCVINGANSGGSNNTSFTITPNIIISPTVSNSGPITTGQTVNLIASNLAPSGQVCSITSGIIGGQYITVSQDIPADNFTIEMWIKTNQSNVGIFSAGSTPITNYASDRHIYIDATGVLRVRVIPVANESFSSNTVVNDNVWHHIVVTHSTTVVGLTLGSSKIYIDGKLTASKSTSTVCFAEQVFRIGVSQEAGSSLYYSGQVDNVRIWNVVKSEAEIRQNANLETPASTTGLIYLAKLNGNANATIGNDGVSSGYLVPKIGGGYVTVYPTYPNADYYTYTWTGQNAPTASINTTQTTTGAADGMYTLSVTPTIGCSNITATTAVTAEDNFVINSTIPTIECNSSKYIYLKNGESSTLTATGCSGIISWVINASTTTGISLIVNAPTSEESLVVTCAQSNGYNNVHSFQIVKIEPQNFNTPVNISLIIYSESNISDYIQYPDPGYFSTILTLHGVIEIYGSSTFHHSEYSEIYGYYIDYYQNNNTQTYIPNSGFEGIDIGGCPDVTLVYVTVGNPCPPLLTLQSTANDIVSGTVIKQASSTNGTINATNAITGTAKATYQAKSIQLNAGFKADNGTVFTAEIGGCASTGSTPTMQVNGRFLYDSNGQKFIPKGVNYPVLDDWNFPAQDMISEIELSGANAVRLPWYINYAGRPTFTTNDLNNLLTKCKNDKIVPIVNIADYTTEADMSVLNSIVVPWWTSPSMLAIINTHKKYLIINLANELGKYRWTGSNAADLLTFKNAYKTAITSIRNAGIDVPIMIDAPDGGSTLSAFLSFGQELINHDPKHNILLDVHGYWAAYDGMSEITTAVSNNLPLIFGEVANKQDEFINGGTVYCYYDLDGITYGGHSPSYGFTYQNLLSTLETQEIGWTAWAWVRDLCSPRNMTNNDNSNPTLYGKYSTLTTYGNNIVNNATYGIKNKAIRSNGF